MKGIRKLMDRIKPNFEKGGRFEKLHSTFDAFETFLFVPDHVTRNACRAKMLQARVIHAEKQSRHQRHDDDDHHSLQVDAVADMAAAAGYVIRYEQERLESIERRMKFFELAALFEVRLDLIYKIS